MYNCNCNTKRGIGIHDPECNRFKDLTFKDFTGLLLFRDFAEDMLRYATGFHHLIQEQPEFYAAAMHSELLHNLEQVFDASDFTGTSAAMIKVHSEWFDAHFTAERLTSLRKSKIVAQELGFSLSFKAGFDCYTEHFFGLYSKLDVQRHTALKAS